jgi:hypothetical protein
MPNVTPTLGELPGSRSPQPPRTVAADLLEVQCVTVLIDGEDHAEGVSAGKEKRDGDHGFVGCGSSECTEIPRVVVLMGVKYG